MAGQVVDLYAWPSDTAQKALKPGQLVPTTLLATATTSGTGRYTLTVPVAKLKAAAVESGYANLEISSAVGGFWFFPYQTGSLPARPAAPVTVNLSSKSKKPLCGGPVDGFQLFNTGFVKQRERKPAWAVVGQGYIASQRNTRGDTVAFSYVQSMSATQTSTLGIGISGYGINAGYNTSGSNVSTATEGVDYPTEPKSSWFRTEFSVGQFRSLCVFSPGVSVPRKKQDGKCPLTHQENANTVEVYKCLWLVKSTGWFGPLGTVQQSIHRHPLPVPHTPASFCGPEGAGITAHTNKEKAIQWSSGFEIGGSTGIKGVTLNASYGSTAQTGYDANAEVFFHFKHNGWLCGTNRKPADAALLVIRGHRP